MKFLPEIQNKDCFYRKDTEHLYHAFVYSPVSILSGIYPLPAMHLLLVTSDVRKKFGVSNNNMIFTLQYRF